MNTALITLNIPIKRMAPIVLAALTGTPVNATSLSLADAPLFATGVLEPNVLLTMPYEYPHNEVFVRIYAAGWFDLLSNRTNLNSYHASDTSLSAFLDSQTYYDHAGLIFPWPASAACTGYSSSQGASRCTPVDIYSSGITADTLTDALTRELYILTQPERNAGTSPTNTPSSCATHSSSDVNCWYTGDRLTRSKRNLYYFQHDNYTVYTPWEKLGTGAYKNNFNNMSFSAAYHNPMDLTLGSRDLANSTTSIATAITGYGLVPSSTGLIEDFNFNFKPTETSASTDADSKMNFYQNSSTAAEWRSTQYSNTYTTAYMTYSGSPSYYANWYTYYRSASLVTKAIAGKVLKGLIDRGTNERFRIGVTKPSGAIVPPQLATTSWIDQLADHIYQSNGAISFYDPTTAEDHASKFFSTQTAYLSDPSSTYDATTNPTYSCRRNFEILVFPDLTTVNWREKLKYTDFSIPGTFASAMLDRYGNADSSGNASDGTANCLTFSDNSPYCRFKDTSSGTFADMAFYGWRNDLMSTLDNNILPTIRNPATWQNVVRYIVAPGGYTNSDGTLVDSYGYVTHGNNIDATVYQDSTAAAAAGSTLQFWSSLSYNNSVSSQYPPYATYDDLYHMALNARGYYSPYGSPNKAVENVTQAFLDILVRNSTGSAVATNTTAIATSGTVYQAALDGDWRGRLRAFKISITDSSASIDASPLWDAAYTLSAQGSVNTSPTSYSDKRRIFTVRDDTFEAAPFRWDYISANQQLILAPASSIHADSKDYYGNQLLTYLRGNGACEQNTTCATYKNASAVTGQPTQFRKRGIEIFSSSNENSRPGITASNPDGRNLLSDITNSSPWYVGPVLPGYSDVDYPEFNEFRKDNYDRDGMVYVGANDGMLHAFWAPNCTSSSACTTANAGYEVFAYIPSFIFSNLPSLADTGYSHQYYVDGSPFASDAYVDGEWKTVLVGGVNKGGKGYYALDVTTPPNLNASYIVSTGHAHESQIINDHYLWEFSSATARTSAGATDDGLGYTYNVPSISRTSGQARQIVRTKYCTDASDKSTCKWAAIVGNGYDETPGKQAALYILFLDGPNSSTKLWTEGTHYRKIPVGLTDYSSDGGFDTNGLSTPLPVDVDSDGFVDYVYAGDLNGNIWKFDLSSTTTSLSTSTWSASYTASGSDIPLFTAKDSSGNRQPIVYPVEISNEPSTGMPIVLFGTGKLLGTSDKTSTSVQSFYSVIDHLVEASPSTLLRNKLKQRTSSNPTISGEVNTDYRVMSTTAFTYCDNTDPSACTTGNDNPNNDRYFGWYWDMPSSGERLTGRPQLINSDIRFNTYIPDLDPCAYGGTGWEMCLDAYSGIQSCLGSGVSFDNASDQYQGLSLFSGQKLGASLGGTSYVPTLMGSYVKIYSKLGGSNEGTPNVVKVDSGTYKGRVSWYELTD